MSEAMRSMCHGYGRALMAFSAAAALSLASLAPALADETQCDPKLAPSARPAGNQSPQPPPDINGNWSTPDGEVAIDFLQSSGSVYSQFNPQGGKVGGDCHLGGHRSSYIDGKFAGGQITGKMSRCTMVKVLIEKCGLDEVYPTDFYTESVTKDRIVGCFLWPYYDWVKSAASGACPYTRDTSRDKWVRVTMTRKGDYHCPDLAFIKEMNKVAARAKKMLDAAAPQATDADIKKILDSSSGALGGVTSELAELVELGEKCDKIGSAIDLLRDFKDAIDEVNSASCGMQSAAAFDHLFTSAGQLGQRFIDVPELNPLFTILANNQSFFQDVSAKLNPEQRWADQFAGIENYQVACP